MTATTTAPALLERIEQAAPARPAPTSMWGPTLLSIAASTVIGLVGLRGADYPGHFIRALTWERTGPSVWSNLWYGGHSTVGYSVLAPAVLALTGPFAAAAIGSVLATHSFTGLTARLAPGPTTSLANYVFASAMLVNVVVGRAPFALGLAAALLALRAWQREWIVVAVAVAVLAPLTSPVAGAFLGIAAVSVALAALRDDRRTCAQGALIAASALAPLAIVGAMFGKTGWFPYRGGHFVITALVLALVAVIARSPVVRYGVAVTAAAATAVFLVPNPLGGNFVRLVQIVAVPLAVVALASVRRPLMLPCLLAVTGSLAWSLSPAVVATADWWGDESVAAAYHDPLIAEVRRRNADDEPLGSWRSRSPSTTGRASSWRPRCRSPAVGSARSISPSTPSSTTLA